MNIFILDKDPRICASYHNDKHVVKMILEHVQMLSHAVSVLHRHPVGYGPLSSHANHPCTKWVSKNYETYSWVWWLTYYLHLEWQYRYDHPPTKHHKAYDVMVSSLPKPLSFIDTMKCVQSASLFSDAPQAMPNDYKYPGNPVLAYQMYYIVEKTKKATWRKRGIPNWIYPDFTTLKLKWKMYGNSGKTTISIPTTFASIKNKNLIEIGGGLVETDYT